MGVAIESLPAYKQQVLADIESKTNQNTPALDVSYNRIIANACAALALTTKLHNIDQHRERKRRQDDRKVFRRPGLRARIPYAHLGRLPPG